MRLLAAALTTALTLAVLTVPTRGQQAGRAVALAEGDGKAAVEATCGRCHGLNLIASSRGYTRDGWTALIASMVQLPEADAAVITGYLARSYAPKPGADAVILPGPAKVTFRDWMAPSLGSRPHDPLAAPDGSLWWSGQFASVLGRVDPKTGAIREFPLRPESGPHGLVADTAGHIWFTGISQHYIGRLDPATGAVTEYPLPEGKARSPHTPIFDQRGRLWFTMQSGMVGRLTPATGEIRVSATPTSGTYPYGIAVNSKGVPWYVDFRGNRLGSVDPETLVITEHALPDPAARPRRIAITPDDAVWYTDYARGYLGRFDPATGQTREWPSPSGRQSQPYGIATIGSLVWYSESGVRPNTLVRFDPAAGSFQTWALPHGGGIVRNMMATRDGHLALALSGVNRVALAEVAR